MFYAAPGHQATVNISGCKFINNTAEDTGGAMYINLSGGDNAYVNITIAKSLFLRNCGLEDAGAIQYTVDATESAAIPGSITIQDCHFENNSAKQYGGVIKALRINSQGILSRVTIERTNFIQNEARATGSGAVLHLQSPFLRLANYTKTYTKEDRITVRDW